jgi:hypothetical protein
MHCYGIGHPFANEVHLGSFTAHAAHLVAGTNSVAKLDPTDRRMKMRDVGMVGGMMWNSSASVQLHTSVALTSLVGAGIGTTTIPAGVLVVGSRIEMECQATRESVGAENLDFWFTVGASNMGPIRYAHGGAVAATPCTVKVVLTIRTTGVGGTADYMLLKDGVAYAVGTATVDTTAAQTCGVSGQHSVSNAGNKIDARQFTMAVTL